MTAKAGKEAKDANVKVRLSAGQLVRLDAAWKAEGFESRSAYLRHLALIGIGEPSAPPAVIEAMRGARSELSAIGRNLNQAIREMHRQRKAGGSADVDLHLEVENLEALNRAVRKMKTRLDRYVSASAGERKVVTDVR